MYKTKAYSAASKSSPLQSTLIPRRGLTERDVRIEVLFCGICHTDLHDVMPAVYPCVPGHEIVGRVTSVGSAVTRHTPGDLVGVGCLVDSDLTCPTSRPGSSSSAWAGCSRTAPRTATARRQSTMAAIRTRSSWTSDSCFVSRRT
jgi:D-arabinose 1-dehydrogenase-like Zn-dependent alcohol dehydrogenase